MGGSVIYYFMTTRNQTLETKVPEQCQVWRHSDENYSTEQCREMVSNRLQLEFKRLQEECGDFEILVDFYVNVVADATRSGELCEAVADLQTPLKRLYDRLKIFKREIVRYDAMLTSFMLGGSNYLSCSR
jgi:hypothetical protein